MTIRPYSLNTLAAVCIFMLGLAPAAMAAEVTTDGVPYTVEITGAENGVERLMRASSQLLSLINRLPATQRALARRIEGDVERFREVLESEGYYAGQVERSVEAQGDSTLVKISVTPGARYAVGYIQLVFGEREQAGDAAILDSKHYESPLRQVEGEPARAEDVIAAEDASIAELQNAGFPFAERGEREVDVDHEKKIVNVSLPVNLGPFSTFGIEHFGGLETVKESYLQELVPWKTGEVFNAGQLEDYRRTLVTSGLFTSVRVDTDDAADVGDAASLDVNVALTEAAHRSVGAGAKYGRDRGFGGSVFWEHRNLFGEAEKLRLSLDGTQLDQTATADLRKPNFLSLNQTLILGAEVKHADTEAFREWSGNLSAALERKLDEHWTVRAGTTLEIASLTEDNVTRTSYLAGLPLSAIYDASDDVLDPTRGWKVSVGLTPYAGAFDGSVAFVKSEAEGDIYVPFDERRRYVFAARLAVGSLVGSATDQIPANRRFYAGGGGSIRGFGYQLVGPLDAENEPTGGRSVIEASIEARLRVTDTIGVVPFVDAGVVSLSSLPGDGGRLRTAAGIGGRYYTAVGPLRLDIAVPLNRRPGVDNSFQFYISFGQAF